MKRASLAEMPRRGAKLALGGAVLILLAMVGLAQAELVQRGNLRVSFDGKISPHVLPRKGSAPVRVAVAAKIASTHKGTPPQLRRISIAINRYGRFTPQGLPICELREIQPATTANALKACRASLVGEGSFSAKVLLSQQAPFPANGKVHVFNGVIGCSPSERQMRSLLGSEPRGSQPATDNAHARGPIPARNPSPSDRGQKDAPCHSLPAIFAHVFGTDPVPTSFTLPFTIESTKGTFGTVMRADLPTVTGNSGYITGLSLKLGRNFSYHGQRRSFLSASCPAANGFPGAVFPFAKASFGFGKQTLTSTLIRNCQVKG